jgi:TonB family protein
MRLAVTFSILLTMAAGAALADDLSDPVWVKAPDRSEWAKAYPSAAASAGVAGGAHVRCVATAAGLLQDCSVVDEAPSGQGFGGAALMLAAGMEMRPTALSGQSVAGRNVTFPVKFSPDLLHPGAIITHPDWMHIPDGNDLARFWPANAKGGGQALLHCVVTNRGLLGDCTVASEHPLNQGFGASALMMTSTFLMRPMTVDGLPVGGAEINLPVNFDGNGYQPAGPSIRVLPTAIWQAAPTAADMAAAYPKDAIGRFESGHVVLQCRIERAGDLRDCDRISEDPADRGFGHAALQLAKAFRTDLGIGQGQATPELYVDVAFDFRDPSRPIPPLELVDPIWVRFADPKMAGAVFPDAAAKAGYKTGKGVVDCGVNHDGSLTDCTVVSEDPPGLGFGDSAMTIAKVMVMNPWTIQGTPVDGARVRVPIRVNLPEDQPVSAPVKPN